MSITIKLDYAPDSSFWIGRDRWIASIFDGEVAHTSNSPGEALSFIGELLEDKYPQLLTDLKKEASK